jgi:hypothetical protein
LVIIPYDSDYKIADRINKIDPQHCHNVLYGRSLTCERASCRTSAVFKPVSPAKAPAARLPFSLPPGRLEEIGFLHVVLGGLDAPSENKLQINNGFHQGIFLKLSNA